MVQLFLLSTKAPTLSLAKVYRDRWRLFWRLREAEKRKEDRKDRRLSYNRSGRRQCLVILRERKGRSLPFVVANQGDAVPYVRDHVGTFATIHADVVTGWDALHAGWDTRRVNHSVAFKDKGVCTNQAESFFSRLHRMKTGTHHHLAVPYLNAYANECAWREDMRRIDNGSQAMTLTGVAIRGIVASGRATGSGN